MNAVPEEPTPEPETPEQPAEPTEPEQPEEPAEPEPEPEQPTEPEALSEKEINKRVDALEREKERHAKRVSEILQEEALDLLVCEACEGAIPGFHYPAEMYPEGSAQRLLYEFLSPNAIGLKHPSRYVRCQTCDGACEVETGARPGTLTYKIVCPDCKGAGYFDREQPSAPVIAITTTTTTTNESTGAPPETPREDFLGRPYGHPNYGKMTTYLSPEEIAIDQRDGFGL